MPESRIYQEDGRVGKRGRTDAIACSPLDAPPKPTVEELLSYGYHCSSAWSNRPQTIPS